MLTFWLHAFLSGFAVMNPIGNVPVFLALVGHAPARERAAVNRRSVSVALGVVTVFALAGTAIFRLFGITLDDFRIAGGILLFVIAFGLMQGRLSSVHHPAGAEPLAPARASPPAPLRPAGAPTRPLDGPSAAHWAQSSAATALRRLVRPDDDADLRDDDPAVTPLGTPILAGPGTIATVITLGGQPPFWMHTLLVLLAFACVLGLTSVLFHYATAVEAHLGRTLISVITRMMGLLLTIVAVQMVVAGIQGIFPHV